MATPVQFWFDPACPWAWMSSRWLLEAAAVRDLDVTWRLMSLYLLNDGREPSDRARESHRVSHGVLRVVAGARAGHGDQVVGPLYEQLGTRIHVKQEPRDRDTAVAALEALDLQAALADAMEDPSWDEVIRADHEDGMSKVGMDVGTPVIALEDTAFFGPVVTPAPKGEAAGLLWDGVVLVARTPGFYELKRTRDQGPIFD